MDREAAVVRRPRGRRTQILLAAAEQFHRRGYHQVAMAEVAAAVGITAPALYRHYRGKPELLRQAVRGGLDELDRAVTAAGTRPERGPVALAEALAAVALDQRALGTLCQRDARLLPAAQRSELRRQLCATVRSGAGQLRAARAELATSEAELLLWSALSVGGSLSYHTFAPPRRRFEQLLSGLLCGVLDAQVDTASDVRSKRRVDEDEPVGRREELLAAAVRLFDERGFDNVSTDRIGAAVGIAGPSLYKHFPTKVDLLAAALVRCRERLWHEVAGTLTGPGEPTAMLVNGLAAYVDFARRHHHYLGAMVSETERLAEPDRTRAVDFRRDFLRLWVDLLRQVRPEYDKAEARIRVHAMFALVNDGVRHPAWRRTGQPAPGLAQLAGTVLGLPGTA
ncbi:TetR/AcrR family transcriptional regulator [Kitasatospora acidiphila]|uniref:TetR/AcrR family transcriptional regulator n=1 Tax=Kitasatospora acidiphila TaxID=2567942 RepID=A0A540W8K2_9ACTN|nr:TetR/AcrR family transcriptional regulator [Kitasatospora acidiphila]TQF04694.1 TetR/AcrR family transcriptional regulator [Kitasatospora acidiphila]